MTKPRKVAPAPKKQPTTQIVVWTMPVKQARDLYSILQYAGSKSSADQWKAKIDALIIELVTAAKAQAA